MTPPALQRIKEIEEGKIHRWDDIAVLLKAFNIAMGIATQYAEDLSHQTRDINPEKTVQKEFEREMSK